MLECAEFLMVTMIEYDNSHYREFFHQYNSSSSHRYNHLSNNEKRAVINLAKAAGEKIMAIYAQDFDVDYKDDSSPLTQADLVSHHCILDGLL